jgi:replicative DNA helicase
MTIHSSFRPMPPTALDAEQGLLGAILHNAEALDKVRALVEPEDFCEQLHAAIFKAMCERRDAGGSIDATLIRVALGNHDLGGVTVGEYIARLYAHATTVVNAPDYAKAIRHAAMMRQVLATAEDAVSAMTTGAVDDPSAYATQMIEALDGVASAGKPDSVKRTTMGAAAQMAIQAASDARLGRVVRGAPYGLPTLNRMTLGMRAGQLVILAGRPGMGKSTAGVSFALAAAQAGHGTYFVSLEMIAQELAERALAALAFSPRHQITYRAIAEGKDLTDADFEVLFETQSRLAGIPFAIEQQAGLTIAQIVAKARQLKAHWDAKGKPLGVVFIDHLGLIRPSKRYAGNRVQEITEITASLKEMAKELGVAVVALCQLSREVEKRNDKRPILSDLRDSGSIEQDADVVIGIFRDEYYLAQKENRTPEEDARLLAAQDTIELEILKQRQGPTGRLKAMFCSIGCNVISERMS